MNIQKVIQTLNRNQTFYIGIENNCISEFHG